jgi:outer membrane protein insertion porin family
LRTRVYILGLIFTIFILAGCVPTRHLRGNEKLLYHVELQGIDKNDPEKIVALYRQKPNRKIPVIGWTPYLSVYYLGKRLYNPAKVQRQIDKQNTRYDKKIKRAGADSTKIAGFTEKKESRITKLTRKKEQGNWLMRSVGEPPSIYDSALTVETVSQINTYLNSKGFFHNKVNYETKERGKKIYLNLKITENEPFRFSDITYNIKDSTVREVINQDKDKALVTVGQTYDEELLGQERDRLELLLRNQGYYDFRKLFITFDVDTSFGGNSVKMNTTISNPADSANHKLYTIRNVYFVGDAGMERFGMKRDTVEYNNINYLYYRRYVSPKVLDKKIRILPGQPYSLIRTNRTQRQIADLDVYRYSTINYTVVKDAQRPMLDTYINVTPAKRFQETVEAGFNISSFTTSNLNPLPFGSVRLKVRNIFGSAENLELGLRGGFEAQPSTVSEDLVTTTELGGNIALYFPQFLIPFNLSNYYHTSIYNPKTRINAAFTYTSREDYDRTNTEFSLDYFWQRSQRLQYVFSPIDINIVNVPFISATYQDRLDTLKTRGIPLIESFRTSIVSSLNGTLLYNSNNINQTRDARYLKVFGEIGNVPKVLSGGKIEKSPYTLLTDAISGLTNQDYKTFSFFKINIDGRRYYKFREKMYLVLRGDVGFASPVPLEAGSILPYDKFFFAGGGSSVRAWRPRKLGPGSYTPPFRTQTNADTGEEEIIYIDGIPQRDYQPEQPGEILIESNVEYRFNIFSYLNGALFVDAGNIWSIQKDESRPGAEFSPMFLQELAVGTGFGLRFDFSFLIIRFDMATPRIDPAEPKGDRYVLNRFRLNANTFKGTNNQNSFNLGIGYPF